MKYLKNSSIIMDMGKLKDNSVYQKNKTIT